MFCPKCGTLSFPRPNGDINCHNYRCGYQGPVSKDFANIRTSTKAEERVFEVIKDSDERKGVLTTGAYVCPELKCDSQEVYSYLEPRLDMAEIQVAMLTCKECHKGWREH